MAFRNNPVRDDWPGRGIRKIVDLYHDLPDLVAKADRHAATSMPHPEDTTSNDFVGLTEEQIEEEKLE